MINFIMGAIAGGLAVWFWATIFAHTPTTKPGTFVTRPWRSSRPWRKGPRMHWTGPRST